MNEPASPSPLVSRQRILRTITECRLELVVLQERLGTPNECRGDIDRASEIVHKINNLTAALALCVE
ncbi:hypothetical protein [Opitutus terrae]|uniref:Uncharacterized protein n=1 Tax=Opitutus terrae (strain DSM 11246 / JCM 15787 / PB90-1) TaxID=452637 RepID=B1ZMX8_OPITP|nr:hypothetical protein [Opitutus terrae]ACB76430.1 hypothetical protein Oter_3150 [Opitutus terrae PB90-1]